MQEFMPDLSNVDDDELSRLWILALELFDLGAEGLLDNLGLFVRGLTSHYIEPIWIADLMAKLVQPAGEISICDPAVGTGTLLNAILNHAGVAKDSAKALGID
jgi:hypothetical protein